MWQSSIPGVFVVSQKVELDNAGHTILHGMADLLIARATMPRAFRSLMKYLSLKVDELYCLLRKVRE